MKRKNRGQSTAEYAVLVGLVVAAITGMALYAQRGLKAKVFDASNAVTAQSGGIGAATLGTTQQYEPYYAGSQSDVQQTATGQDVYTRGALTSRGAQTSSRTGRTETGVNLDADQGWEGTP